MRVRVGVRVRVRVTLRVRVRVIEGRLLLLLRDRHGRLLQLGRLGLLGLG